MKLFNDVTNQDLRRFAAARGLVVLVAMLVAGCGGGEPESTRFVPADAASSPETRRTLPANAERDARPARNIATH